MKIFDFLILWSLMIPRSVFWFGLPLIYSVQHDIGINTVITIYLVIPFWHNIFELVAKIMNIISNWQWKIYRNRRFYSNPLQLKTAIIFTIFNKTLGILILCKFWKKKLVKFLNVSTIAKKMVQCKNINKIQLTKK